MPREQARKEIQKRIEIGQQLAARAIASVSELDQARADGDRWSKYNADLLTRLFDTTSLADEYTHFGGMIFTSTSSLDREIQSFRENTRENINRLMSIDERLELIGESIAHAPPGPARSPSGRDNPSRDVFVVHGHDKAARESVARVVSLLGLNPIILAEQPNAGRTLIEKLEHQDVGFAVVLLTPDDLGAQANARNVLKPRARQNVILELGYFIGVLGRAKVCPLHAPDVELPSDYLGVAYIPLDERGAWKYELGREMRAAGLDVDMNKLL